MERNNKSMKIRFNILQDQYQREMMTFYQQPAVLDVNEEKEQLQLEIQQLKESIDNMFEHYNFHNESLFEIKHHLKFERDLREQINLLREKIKQFNN